MTGNMNGLLDDLQSRIGVITIQPKEKDFWKSYRKKFEFKARSSGLGNTCCTCEVTDEKNKDNYGDNPGVI